MILWLWIGGGIMALGTLLAAFPGTRRRIAIDPVSAPIAVGGPDPEAATGVDDHPPADTAESEDHPTEVPV